LKVFFHPKNLPVLVSYSDFLRGVKNPHFTRICHLRIHPGCWYIPETNRLAPENSKIGRPQAHEFRALKLLLEFYWRGNPWEPG